PPDDYPGRGRTPPGQWDIIKDTRKRYAGRAGQSGEPRPTEVAGRDDEPPVRGARRPTCWSGRGRGRGVLLLEHSVLLPPRPKLRPGLGGGGLSGSRAVSRWPSSPRTLSPLGSFAQDR